MLYHSRFRLVGQYLSVPTNSDSLPYVVFKIVLFIICVSFAAFSNSTLLTPTGSPLCFAIVVVVVKPFPEKDALSTFPQAYIIR